MTAASRGAPRLGIGGARDLVLFIIILGYALAIFALMVGAVARDFGLASFTLGEGRPVLLDLTIVTAILSAIILSLALMWLGFAVCSLLFRPHELDPDTIEIHSPTVSVLIPAHNEETVIRDLVQDVLAQDYEHLEVVVVAHNCSDGTVEALAGIEDPRLRVVDLHTEDSGKALALNHALASSRGELVAQFDADNRLPNRRLVRTAVAYYLTEPGTRVIQCQVETKNADENLLTRLQAVEYRIFSTLFWGGRNAVGLPCPIAGTGVFFRREVLTAVGGWDNELVEDYDLYCKLVIQKVPIAYKPDLTVLDEKPPAWRILLRQRSRWQRGHMEVFAKRCRQWMGLSDMLYLGAPIANAAWYTSTVITLLYHVLPWSFTYWYPPAFLWLTVWALAYASMGAILVRTGHTKDLKYLPAFFIYGFHWLVAFLLAFRVRGWSASKTPHGIAR